MSIDQNQKVVEIPTPQDAEIARLGVELNKTYLPYGKMGQAGQARQSAQDANAVRRSPSVLASRSVSKGNAFYCNDAWDLVDAIKNGKCKLEELKDEDLPAELQQARQGRPQGEGGRGRQAARGDPGEDPQAEQGARSSSWPPNARSRPGTKEDTLDQAIVKAIRDQAARHNFKFE